MWKLKADDRLENWKQFRRRIGTLPVDQALVECTDFWSRAPFTPFYLEHDNTNNWPDPWQLVYENYYCDLAKALGIVYTMYLSEHGATMSFVLRVYKDPKTQGQYNLVWIDDGKYVLNFIPGEVVNKKHIPTELKLLAELTSLDLKLDQY